MGDRVREIATVLIPKQRQLKADTATCDSLLSWVLRKCAVELLAASIVKPRCA